MEGSRRLKWTPCAIKRPPELSIWKTCLRRRPESSASSSALRSPTLGRARGLRWAWRVRVVAKASTASLDRSSPHSLIVTQQPRRHPTASSATHASDWRPSGLWPQLALHSTASTASYTTGPIGRARTMPAATDTGPSTQTSWAAARSLPSGAAGADQPSQ